MKYLEVGHTSMSADSDHHTIEKALKDKTHVQDYQDFTDTVRSTGINVVEMTKANFLNLEDGVSPYQMRLLGDRRPFLRDVVVAQFRRGSLRSFYFKKEFDSAFVQYQILKSSFDVHAKCQKRTRNRGVNSEKKNTVVSNLCGLMDTIKRPFWEDLDTAEVRDLHKQRVTINE